VPERHSITVPPLDDLKRTEWSDKFERLMRNRLLIGALRYGRIGADDKPSWDRMQRARRCIDEYEKTGNLEHLVDLGNMALLEFEEGTHPKRHFAAADDGVHTQERV